MTNSRYLYYYSQIIYSIIITANNNDITFIVWLANSVSEVWQEDFWRQFFMTGSFVQALADDGSLGMPFLRGRIPEQVRWAPGCAEGCQGVTVLVFHAVRFYFQINENITLIHWITVKYFCYCYILPLNYLWFISLPKNLDVLISAYMEIFFKEEDCLNWFLSALMLFHFCKIIQLLFSTLWEVFN